MASRVSYFGRRLSVYSCNSFLKCSTSSTATGKVSLQRCQQNGSDLRLFCGSASSYKNLDIITKDKVFLNTNGLSNTLEENGFPRQQAECLTSVLLSAFSKNAEITSTETVSKEQLEISVQILMAHLSAVKKDMIILERSEFSALRTENDRLEIKVKQLTKQLKDEINNLGNKVALDINLEKSRVKDEAHAQQMLIETNKNLITTEVANIMSKLEATKNDIFRYFAATILASLTIGLGFYRIWAK